MLFVVRCDLCHLMFSATCSVFGVGGLNATAWATVDRPRVEQLMTHQASKKPIQRNNWKIRGLYVRSEWLMSSRYEWFPSLVSAQLFAISFLFLCHLKVFRWSLFFRGSSDNAALCVLGCCVGLAPDNRVEGCITIVTAGRLLSFQSS